MATRKEQVKLAKEIGERLVEVRGDRTLTGFAEEIGVWPATLTNYENGRNLPGAYFLQTVAEIEGVDLNWLVSNNGWAPGEEEEYQGSSAS